MSLGKIVFKGKSGTEYEFEIYEYGQTFKALGAVYAITKQSVHQDNTIWHTRVYVGETGDLSERFDDHHKEPCFGRNGANRICIHLCANKRDRLTIEDDLLKGNSWTCND